MRAGLGLGGRLVQRYGDYLVAAQRDHLAPLAVLDCLGCPQAVARREDAVEGGRGASTLQMPEDDVAGGYGGAVLGVSR